METRASRLMSKGERVPAYVWVVSDDLPVGILLRCFAMRGFAVSK